MCSLIMMDLDFADEQSSELELSPILKLNADCLKKVFQYLSLADQIRLAQTCTRMQTFFGAKNKFVSNETTRDLTLTDTRRYFQLSGQHFQSLRMNGLNNDNFKHCFYAGFDFPNLKKLDVLDYNPLDLHKLQRILLGTTKLKELLLRIQPRTDRLELAHLTELKKLSISEWKTESLSLPTSIDTLTVHGWQWDALHCLPNFLKDKTHIKKLQMLDTFCVSNEFFDIHGFAFVEVLHVRCPFFGYVNSITHLPRLKKLWFDQLIVDSRFFSRIVRHRPQQLDHLEMVYDAMEGFRRVGIDKTFVLIISDLIGLHTLFLKSLYFVETDVVSKLGKLTELKRLGLFYDYMDNKLALELLTKCPKLSSLRFGNMGCFDKNLVQGIISLVRSEIQGGRNQRELPLKLQLAEYYRLRITSTDPDILEVFFTDRATGWLNEEFEVKN